MALASIGKLFRSSRPDFIETGGWVAARTGGQVHCSGLPGRTSLRHVAHRRQVECRGCIVPVFQAGLH